MSVIKCGIRLKGRGCDRERCGRLFRQSDDLAAVFERQQNVLRGKQSAYMTGRNPAQLDVTDVTIDKKAEKWWRRRELNPRPKMLLVKRLHAYSRSCPRHYPETFAAAAQNGQETPAASLRS